MSSCCQPDDYDKVFDEKHARTKARDYARKGLTGDARRIVDFIRGRMSQGYDVLEVGGGVGEIQLELLKTGAAHVTNVELATRYETVASELVREHAVTDRVERRLGDFVREAGAVPAADVVVMNRVVCCYPDPDALVGAAASHARRLLVMTVPVDRWWVRLGLWAANMLLAIRGNSFRGYAHPTRGILATAQQHGMTPAQHRRGLIWQLIALERTG
jgi:magnesium-protoporphyrin O-methyltransferase